MGTSQARDRIEYLPVTRVNPIRVMRYVERQRCCYYVTVSQLGTQIGDGPDKQILNSLRRGWRRPDKLLALSW